MRLAITRLVQDTFESISCTGPTTTIPRPTNPENFVHEIFRREKDEGIG